MHDPAATLELEAKQRQLADAERSRKAVGGRAMKFNYPSGAKPLDGYTLKRGIGIGGFGEVYFALSDAGKEVALKKINRNLDIELRGVKQCLNLKHVNLISLWDIRTNEAGESWVVMEYVPGESLRDVIEHNKNGMTEELVKDWFVSIAAGVAYLHDHGIVHRDLKPGNVFFDSDQQVVKIGDYGLSKFISCSRRSGQTESVGTFHYMAPEIGKGVYGKEIDIYALGIILFEMLTGDVPFEGESSQEIMMKHLTADPDVSRVPAKFRQVISKSMLKDPEQRYANVPEMLSDLPWLEIAENGQDIVNRMSVGPMVNGTATKQAEEQNSKGLNPILVSDGKSTVISPNEILPKPSVRPGEIVFGELRDTNAGVRPRKTIDVIQTGAGMSPIMTTTLPDEPIAKAVHTGWAGVTHWWTNGNISTPVKVAILIGGTIAVASNSQWLLPTALALALCYLIYYPVRAWILKPKNADEEAENTAASQTPRISRRQQAKFNREAVRNWLGSRDISDRFIELLGSLLIAAIACTVFNLLGVAIGGSIFEASIESWAQFTWMTLTCVAGSWVVLIGTKFWENRDGDHWSRRLTLAGMGVIVGFVAFLSSAMLHVDLAELTRGTANANFPSELVMTGLPAMPAMLVFFAGLFFTLRWWKHSDPIRRTRLSIWNVGLCLVWAAIFSHVLNIAPLWTCIMATVVSISVQLAAPWLHPRDRKRIERETSRIPVAGNTPVGT